MSISWADRFYMAIQPFDLDDVVKELRKKKPKPEALKAAAFALEMVKGLLEGDPEALGGD